MHDVEAIQMMRRCREEIASQRATIERLRPKAEAYDVVARIISLIPYSSSMGAGEDLTWVLDKRIRETEHELAKRQTPAEVASEE